MKETVKAKEIMVVMAARELKPFRTVLVGVGLPNLAANLAKKVFNENLILVYESGVLNSIPGRLPLSIGDPTLLDSSDSVFSIFDTFSYVISGGCIDVGFLGAGQVDVNGNLNTTVIGDYQKPDSRLPGSGGACEISYSSKITIVMTQLSKRKLLKTVDFVTSPGIGQNEKEQGPNREGITIITDLCSIKFSRFTDPIVNSIYDIADLERIRDITERAGVSISSDVSIAPPITSQELSALRELDKNGLYLE